MSTSAETHLLDAREARWRQEAAFFDQVASDIDQGVLPIDPLALQRYTRPTLRRRFDKEYRFSMLGPLEGKSVLDLGCGDGLNAAMFARMGAYVTGIDVSAGALEVAQRRAEVNRVANRVYFVCAPVEEANLAPGSFDVVWGEGILHHVLDELDLVLRHLARWARPQGLLVFSEPINLCPALRRLRGLIPVRTEATPGERPMLTSELELVRCYVPDLRIRHYSLLGRLDRFLLVNHNYERSPQLRRGLVGAIDAVDWVLLSLPFLTKFAGECVMYGHPRLEAAAPETGSSTGR